MMKVAIVYYSMHHGNTKKLLDAIQSKYDVTLVNVVECQSMDLSAYDCIGIASGIYFASFAKQVLSFAKENLPKGKNVFFMNTCGKEAPVYFESIRKITKSKECIELGTYQCLGFDTFGPFKLVGGISKGHPSTDEIEGAVTFFETIIKRTQ